MKKIVGVVVFSGLMLIVFGLLAACAGPPAVNVTLSPAAAPAPSSSLFKVTSLAINPPEVNAGIPALITAKVINTGSKDDAYQGNIRIESTDTQVLPSFLGSNQVTIQAGGTQLLSATTTIIEPGSYKVIWDGISQSLVVDPAEATAPGAAPVGGYGTAPGFSAVDVVTGKPVSLSQFKGSAVLLNFVNYGCNPSLNDKVDTQLQAIKQLSQQRKDFIPLSVFCGCCSPDVLRQFAKENSFNWPWVLDTNYAIAPQYGQFLKLYGYPTLVFIDANQAINDVSGYTDLAGLSDRINKVTTAQTTQ